MFVTERCRSISIPMTASTLAFTEKSRTKPRSMMIPDPAAKPDVRTVAARSHEPGRYSNCRHQISLPMANGNPNTT
jgi:hypothetical protein